jgi:transposase
MAGQVFGYGGPAMGRRHEISDADWDRVRHLLPGQPGQHGGIAEDNRRFLNAVLYVAKTGIPWRDLPDRYGNWNSQWRRFDRWAEKGRWDPVMAALRDPDLDVLILDSTAVRAHACAAGAKKKSTGLAARTIKRLAAAAGGSGRRFTAASTGSGTPSSWC